MCPSFGFIFSPQSKWNGDRTDYRDPCLRCFKRADSTDGLSSSELSEAQLYDYGQNFIRTQLATVEGDDGAALATISGLNPGDLIMQNPNDAVRQGAEVRATIVKPNLDVQSGAPNGAPIDDGDQVLALEPGAAQTPQEPSLTNKQRGPGY